MSPLAEASTDRVEAIRGSFVYLARFACASTGRGHRRVMNSRPTLGAVTNSTQTHASLSLGTGLGDRFGAPRGASGPLKESTPTASVVDCVNSPRVRDGYANPLTRGHLRARATCLKRPTCRQIVYASNLRCPRLPSRDLHGKEGVDGSSPSEGFDIKPLQIGM